MTKGKRPLLISWRTVSIACAVGITMLGAAALNLMIETPFHFPVLYVIPITIAAYHYSPRRVGVLATGAVGLEALNTLLESTNHRYWWIRLLSVTIMGMLTVLLSAQRQKAHKATVRAERALAEVQHLAAHDHLTGLPNRRVFLDQLHQMIQQAKRQADVRYAVIFIDCDGFKDINDRYGHEIGDQLLVHVGQCLQKIAREYDTVARLGGDEFTVLLRGLSSLEHAHRIEERIRAALDMSVILGGHRVQITASMGLVLGSEAFSSPKDILHAADQAMYLEKARLKSRFSGELPAAR